MSALVGKTWVNVDDSGIRVLMAILKPVQYVLACGAFRSAFEALRLGSDVWGLNAYYGALYGLLCQVSPQN